MKDSVFKNYKWVIMGLWTLPICRYWIGLQIPTYSDCRRSSTPVHLTTTQIRKKLVK